MKTLFRSIVFIVLYIALTRAGVFAATKTWVGGTGAALNWTTGTNWLPAGAPVGGDDVVFNTPGILTFTTGPGANFSFNSLSVSSGTVTLIGTGASRTFTLGGATGTDFIVAGGATLVIGSNLNITMANSSAASIDGTFTVNSGRTFNTNGSLVVTTVNGTISNSGTVTCTTAAKLLMQGESAYIHSRNGGNIPTATWNAGSTCSIIGVTTNAPSGNGQAFANFTWASASTGQVNMLTSSSITGNLTISNGTAGAGNEVLNAAASFSIGGNLVLSGSANMRIASNTARTISVSGNFSMSGGTINMTTGNQTGTLQVAGNFSHTGGTITETGSASGAIIFNGSTAQSYTSGGTVSNTINWTVNNDAILNMATEASTVTGNAFTLSAGGTLGITSTAGIVAAPTASGNIRTTTRTFHTGANYSYIGMGGAQVTGNALPSTINSLVVNNTAGISLTGAVTLNAASSPLTLTSGIVSGATITISSAYTGAGGGGSATSHVNGPIAKTGSTAYEFPVGNGTIYRPISVSGLSASATITARYFQVNPKTTFGTALGSGIHHIGICEYWTLDDGPASVTGIVGLKFGISCNSYAYVDNPATLLVAHWNGSQWENLGNNGSATPVSVTANSSSGFSPFTIGSSSAYNPLPVKIGSIKAYEKRQGVQIDWTAFTEINLEKYKIERSVDGVNFTAIGEVTALNSPNETHYGFFDASPFPGLGFYRLRSLDIDGKTGFSNIVRINLDRSSRDITLYPNPVRTGSPLSYSISQLAKGKYDITIFNQAGMQVFVQSFSHSGGAINQTIQLPAVMQPGLYSLRMQSAEAKIVVKTFLVQ